MLLIAVLAIVGLISLLGGALSTVAVGIGTFVVLPILLFKLFFILMVFGFVGRRMRGRHGYRRRWGPPRWEGDDAPAPSDEDRFEEWHRLAHAREEVDGWVDGVADRPE